MTSKLKCPFCQQELGVILCDPDDIICPKCRLCGTESLWQALIQSQRDLQIARQALEDVQNDALTKNRYHIIADVNHALEKITHDNKG